METKHTPGPWFLGSDSDFIFDSNDENANIICRFFNREEHDYENKEANARLTVVAPELLEFAIEMVRMYPNIPWINEHANKLIKKATEQPLSYGSVPF